MSCLPLLVEIPQCHNDSRGTEGLLKAYGRLQRKKEAVIMQPEATDTWLFHPRACYAGPQVLWSIISQVRSWTANCPEVSGNKDSLTYSPT